MPPFDNLPSSILLLEFLLHVIPSSCDETQYRSGRIFVEHFRRGIWCSPAHRRPCNLQDRLFPLAPLIAVPIYILGQGLMIYFRQPGVSVGFLVMCQIFMAIGGSIIILCEQLAVMAAVEHQQIASVLALLNLFGWLGGAIGNTISGAIWTKSFPQALAELLPPVAKPELEDIYGSLDVQLSYEAGSPSRDLIELAYGFAQKRMLIAGTAIMGLALVWIMLIKNYNVSKMHQVKGRVF